jgi:DNA-binding NarL/FixJ family response regulator
MNNTDKRIRVILADDHTLVRAGIRALLEKMSNLEIVAEANDGREAIALAREHGPDVLVMDISMPNLNGLEAAARLNKEQPGIRVIILSRHKDEAYFWEALKKGASGYVLKGSGPRELAAAIERVMSGEIYLSKEISQKMLKKLPLQHIATQSSPLERLTERQREILQLIAEGETTKSIALQLQISPKTVEYHRAKMMELLNIFDIPNLVRFALKHRLIVEES